jgi:hypothetical protein
MSLPPSQPVQGSYQFNTLPHFIPAWIGMAILLQAVSVHNLDIVCVQKILAEGRMRLFVVYPAI